MKVTCKYCGIVQKPHECPHKRKRKTNRYRGDTKQYQSKGYKKTRKTVLSDYDNLCLWSLYVIGEVNNAEETHHIIEVLEDESKAKDYDNLIPLTESNHDVVHALYKRNPLTKGRTQELLRKMLNDYKNGDLTLGKYKNNINNL